MGPQVNPPYRWTTLRDQGICANRDKLVLQTSGLRLYQYHTEGGPFIMSTRPPVYYNN